MRHEHERCPHCHATGQIERPSAMWRAAIVPAWITCGVMVLGAGMIGPFILMVVPLLFAGGVGLLSTVYARASEPPTCEACGKIVPDTVTRATPTATPHGLAHPV